jgi:hypothetical protein
MSTAGAMTQVPAKAVDLDQSAELGKTLLSVGVIKGGIMSYSTGDISLQRALQGRDEEIRIPPIGLPGKLQVPQGAYALVAFAHGSGSSRLSPRNRAVASALNRGVSALFCSIY